MERKQSASADNLNLLVAACRDHSTTLRYPQTTLKLPPNYPTSEALPTHPRPQFLIYL